MYSNQDSFLDLEARKKILELTIYFREQKSYPILTPQSIVTSECESGFCFAVTTQFLFIKPRVCLPLRFYPFNSRQISKFFNRNIMEQTYINSSLQKKIKSMQNAESKVS